MVKIYKLIKDDEIVYIGKTKLKLSRRKNGAYHNIDRDFIRLCKIELIEETEDVSRERYWIEYYKKQGCKLLNIRNGEYNEEQRKTLRRIDPLKKQKPGRKKIRTKDDIRKQKKDWYDKNKDRINKERREKYKIDPWYKKVSK